MDTSDGARSPQQPGSYAGRRRSISIIDAEAHAGHSSPLSAHRTRESVPLPPPPLNALHPDTHTTAAATTSSSNSNHLAAGTHSASASASASPSKAPTRAPLATPRSGVAVASLFDDGSTAGGGGGRPLSKQQSAGSPHAAAPERTSLFRVPSYRPSSASPANNGGSFHALSTAGGPVSPSAAAGAAAHNASFTPGNANLPTSWRRAFSPLTSANMNATGVGVGGGGSSIGFGGTSSTAGPTATAAGRPQRPSSLLHRRPSSALSGGFAPPRGAGGSVSGAGGALGSNSLYTVNNNGTSASALAGGGGTNANTNTNTAAAAAATASAASLANVYTLHLNEDDGGAEMAEARPLLLDALRLRDSYKGVDKGQVELAGGAGGGAGMGGGSSPSAAPPLPVVAGTALNGPTALQQVDGVYYWTDERTPIVSWGQFATDVMVLASCVQHPSCISVSSDRLQVLEEKYHLHRLYNADAEENSDRYRRGGGLYANACRVDNYVEAATVMNAHWLVEYMQQTIEARGGDVVVEGVVDGMGPARGGTGTNHGGGSISGVAVVGGGGSIVAAASQGDAQTLERVCELLDFPDPYQLTVEGLGLQPSVDRALPYYDALDPALNGSGRNSAALLRLFLSPRASTPQKGEYLAGAVQPSLTRNELRTSCPQATEMALEITGVLAQEWERTAAWVRAHELDSYRTNQFQINFPVTKWCTGAGAGGHTGSSGHAAMSSSSQRGSGFNGGDVDGGFHGADGQQGYYRHSLNGGAAGNGHSLSLHHSPHNGLRGAGSPTMADAAAVPLDAAPEDVLSYENYQQLLDHLFLPLFMATLAPEDPRFVDLASLLQHTGAIVLSGDESARTRGALGAMATGGGSGGDGGGGGSGSPEERTSPGRDGDGAAASAFAGVGGGNAAHDGSAAASNGGGRRSRRRPADVPYTEPVSLTYMCYHIWANVCSLNALRRRRGLNVLQLRVVASSTMLPNTSSPHDASLLLLSYLVADAVVDAVALDKQPALQYLYGLHQVGVVMCPIARGSLGTTSLSDHPLPRLLWRGLHVSLATFSPLYYHASQEPLIEEYASAAKCHRLSPTDISEISLHSVCLSAFDEDVKASWIGAAFLREGWRGNVAELTNVPTARLQLRHDAWLVERRLLFGGPPSSSMAPPGPLTSAPAAMLHGGEAAGGKRASAVQRRDIASAGAGRYAAMSGAAAAAAAAASAVPQPSPYTVLDPAVSFPRLFLTGPYDRDIAHAHIAQSLHRALDLRHQYTSLPLPHPSTLPPSPASVEAAAAADGSSVEDVRNSWLAALIRDPAAVLPHPTQSMSWAFKKAPLGPAVGAAAATPTTTAASFASRPHLRFDEDEWKYKTVEGVIVPHEVHQIPRLPQDMYRYEDFCRHVQELRHLIDHIRVREFALRRLQLLEHRFQLHAAVNHSRELGSTAGRATQNRDFYQSTKVDNNIRMETGMTARQLLAFIVDKATHSGDDIVSHPAGKEPQTLRQLLSELHISPQSLTVDDLNIQAGATSSDGGAPHNPFAQDDAQDTLLTLLLKTDNQMNGRYFAEVTKRTFEELSRDQHTFVESRLPVYGASAGEWGLLSHWFDTHGMASSHNQWVVQVPRIYSSLRKAGRVASFAEYLEHIFEPLWRISLHPNSDPRLFHFVNHIAAFDCVEDERRPDLPLSQATRAPHEWTSEEEPPYNYYLYHLYANLRSLNRFRQRRRFSVFAFRPSCGEAGSVDHLIGGFLLAQNINYGVRLADSAPLQYLFYLAQIGVTVSPLSNNTKLQLNYLHNPFPEFFRRGLRVSLGTDSPLLYHHTQEPLLEEYSIASKIWKLSPNDLSEVARNSVLLSNFCVSFKEEKLGPLYFLSSSAGNDVARTHLSDVRVAYRFETYHTEVGFLEYISGQHFHKALLTLSTEALCRQLCGVDNNNNCNSGGSGVDAAGGDGSKTQQQQQQAGPGALPRTSTAAAAAAVMDVLIDPTPKEDDLRQLEQQRSRMQRQLRELTAAVADLHKQNRLLTTKLGEEKERDQQAAHLRRHRVGDKLRELQVLLDQKTVQQHGNRPPALAGISTAAGGGAGGDKDEVRAVAAVGDAATRDGVSTAAGPLPPSHSASVPAAVGGTAGSGAPGKLTQSGDRGGAAMTATTAHGGHTAAAVAGAAAADGRVGGGESGPQQQQQEAAGGGEEWAGGAPSMPTLSSKDVFSSVRSRATAQREATIAQTRQLLAHSELLWRSTEGTEKTGLPSLDRSPPVSRKR